MWLYNLNYIKTFLLAKIKEPVSASLALTHQWSLWQLLERCLVSASGQECASNRLLPNESQNTAWVWKNNRDRNSKKNLREHILVATLQLVTRLLRKIQIAPGISGSVHVSARRRPSGLHIPNPRVTGLRNTVAPTQAVTQGTSCCLNAQSFMGISCARCKGGRTARNSSIRARRWLCRSSNVILWQILGLQ